MPPGSDSTHGEQREPKLPEALPRVPEQLPCLVDMSLHREQPPIRGRGRAFFERPARFATQAVDRQTCFATGIGP